MRHLCFLAACLLCACSMPKEHILNLEATKKLEMISAQISCRYPLELITNASGQIADDNQACFGLGFISQGLYTLEEARPMILDLAHTFNQALDSYPVFTVVVNNGGISKKAIAIKIAFWDSNMNRPAYPYLAQIKLSQGSIYYYYANPQTAALQAPIIEELQKK